MVYILKRYFSYRLKSVEIFFRTQKNQREIARAYRAKKAIPTVTITRPMLIKAGIAVCAIGILIIGILLSDSIIKNIQSITAAIQNKQKTLAIERRKQKKVVPEKQQDSSRIVESAVKKETPEPAVPKESVVLSNLHKRILPFAKEMRYCILANKATKAMHVLRKRGADWNIFRSYSMAIGEQEGRKLRSGDKKTPEGLYFIVGRKEKSELTSMYGPLAFVLNYPNAEDRKLERTGNGIWIHGTNPDSMPVQTRGCLELSNSNITELGRYLKTGVGTPVVIVNKMDITDPITFPNYKKISDERETILTEYTHRSNYFISLLNQWEAAWESQNITQYSIYYHPDKFFSQGMEWDAWKERKQRTFEMYSTIEISLDKIFLSEFSESTAVLKFLQGYKSDRLNVVNGKKLSLVKSSGAWKIYRENSLPKEELLL